MKRLILINLSDLLIPHHPSIRLEDENYQKKFYQKIKDVSRKGHAKVNVELYVDTVLGRMGMPYHLARPWAQKVASEFWERPEEFNKVLEHFLKN